MHTKIAVASDKKCNLSDGALFRHAINNKLYQKVKTDPLNGCSGCVFSYKAMLCNAAPNCDGNFQFHRIKQVIAKLPDGTYVEL